MRRNYWPHTTRNPRTAALARRARLLLAGVLLAAGVLMACAPSIDEREAVHILTADAQVNPVLARYIDRGIDEAEDTDAVAVVIKLDTPGGLVTSMEDIVQRIQSSEVPVIVYVSPSGGKAASAGTFITMSAHVAAMAPGTRIGAAHPIAADGGDIEGTLGEKVENDAAAYARSIAEERDRNADWAERAVRDSVSASTTEAVEQNIVDYEAEDIDELLGLAEERTVKLRRGDYTIGNISGAGRVNNNMTFFERVLLVLSDPNIAFLLLSLGGLGILIELFAPGIGVPGVFGVISLILAFFVLGTLPVNWAGVALILLAFALFAAEAYAPGFGVFGIGGAVALIVGGLIMTTSDQPEFQVSRWLVLGMAIVLATLVLTTATAIIRARRQGGGAIGAAALVGQMATVRSQLDPDGFIFVKGERWKAFAEGAPIHEGEPVEVTGANGLTLQVRRPGNQPTRAASRPKPRTRS